MTDETDETPEERREKIEVILEELADEFHTDIQDLRAALLEMDLDDELTALVERSVNLARGPGQKTDRENTELAERITDRAARELEARIDEQSRNDLGELKSRPVDDGKLTDDHGRRKGREGGLTERQKRRKLDELTDSVDAVEPLGGYPTDEADDDGEAVDPAIREAAERGW